MDAGGELESEQVNQGRRTSAFNPDIIFISDTRPLSASSVINFATVSAAIQSAWAKCSVGVYERR